MTISDYSEVMAGRSQRLAKLDHALATGKFAEARAMALRDYVDAALVLRWIERKLRADPNGATTGSDESADGPGNDGGASGHAKATAGLNLRTFAVDFTHD